MTAERSGVRVSAPSDLSGRFQTDRRLKLCFALLLAVTTVIRVLLSVFPKTAVTYNDELFYLEIAQNLWRNGSVSVYSAPIRFTKVLYPALISPFYAVTDGMLRTQLISGFNALLLSSSLIPGWLLARRILKSNGQVLLALAILAMSPNLLFSVTFMAENLYYPLLLWGFLILHRYLGTAKPTPLQAVLPGVWAFLLYAAKESGAAFLLGLVLVLLVARRFTAVFPALAGFGIPWIVLRLIIFGNIGYTYAHQAAVSYLSTAPQLMYFLWCCFILLLWFLGSSLWFPFAVPLLHRKRMPGPDRFLLFFSATYILAVTVGTAYGVMLDGGPMTAEPRVHLRYFLGAAWPFLLLFLADDGAETASRGKPLVISTAVYGLAVLLFLYLPSRGSLVDAPVMHYFDWIPKIYEVLWICRGTVVLLTAALLALILLRKRKAYTAVFFVSLTLLSLAGGVSFTQSAQEEERATDDLLAADTEITDRFLDELGGNTLFIVPDLYDSRLKYFNTVSNNDYAVVTTEDILRLAAADRPDPCGRFLPAPVELPVPWPEFSPAETYGLPSIDHVVMMDDWRLIDPTLNKEVTPYGVSSFRVYRSLEPAALNLTSENVYFPGTLIRFSEDDPMLPFYEPTGFAQPEGTFTWSGETEVTLTLSPYVDPPRDLMATWNWVMTNGVQPCEIFANDISIRSETLSNAEKDIIFYIPAESYASTGSLTLRFLFPEACEPGNGDPRTLAVAFESLMIE